MFRKVTRREQRKISQNTKHKWDTEATKTKRAETHFGTKHKTMEDL